jgi:hypothetical protein
MGTSPILKHVNPKTTGTPLVSVFMAVYNGEDYILEAVEAVLCQTETDFEIVVVDDGSTDGTAGILASIDDERLQVFSKENEGIGAPLNPWLQKCRGSYIMRIDADDICRPMRMRSQVEHLEQHPDVVIVGGQFQHFSGGQAGSQSSLPLTHDQILDGMRNGIHTMSHATTMWRANLLTQMDGYGWSGPGEDWSLLLEAARYGKLANLEDVVYDVRLHSASSSAQGAQSVLEGFAYARERYERFLAGEPDYTVAQFRADADRGPLDTVILRLRAQSLLMHRKSQVARFNGDRVHGFALLAGAAALDPRKTVGALWKVWRRRMPASTS